MIKKIFVLLSLTTIIACSNRKLEKHTEEINNYLIENIDKKQFTLVFDTISSFKWDEMIVVGPYVDLTRVSNNSEYDFSDFPTTIKSHDKYVLIGFINNKIGIRFIEIDLYLLSDTIFESPGKNYKIYEREHSNLNVIK